MADVNGKPTHCHVIFMDQCKQTGKSEKTRSKNELPSNILNHLVLEFTQKEENTRKRRKMRVENMSIFPENLHSEESSDVWVFGYGSLTWNPDFPFEERYVGCVKGFVRRFWQGSTWHRGDEKKPGRVVTLVEETEGRVWGIAFKVPKELIKPVFKKLFQREIAHGGYELHRKSFYPHQHHSTNERVISVFLYVATPSNPLFTGQEPTETLAQQIARARGKCGPNVEYLFRLTDFMREQVPGAEDEDEHLFHIDFLVRKELGLPVDEISPWIEIVDRITQHPLIVSS